MPIAIPTPRVNNNDDLVRFTRGYVEPGTLVEKGQIIADIETDKASVTVEADQDGYLLAYVPPPGEMIPVGSTLAWLGSSPDEPVPAGMPDLAVAGPGSAGEPTLKAALLLARFGLSAAEVPASGPRLTADDVLRYARHHRAAAANDPPRHVTTETAPDLPPGTRVPLDVVERGMVRTVSWHRDTAVAGYVEIAFETTGWEEFAAAFQAQHRLLMSPLLPLMAYRLVELARENPKINSTVVGDTRYEYADVNLGFTLQSGSRLSLLAVREAGRLSAREFVDALNALMRRGMKNTLTAEETSGVTIAFSSMARWGITRHVPVLPPHTALIVAHTADRAKTAALGASYDHRVLTGGEVAAILNRLASPADTRTATGQQR